MSRPVRRASLFDAMSKAPQVQEPVPRGLWKLPWKREDRSEGPRLTVAQPLTEEEVAAELAAEQAEAERVRQERRAKLEESAAHKAKKEEERFARAARKAEEKARRLAESTARRASAGLMAPTHQRHGISISWTSFGGALVGMFALAFGAYSIGKHYDKGAPAGADKGMGQPEGLRAEVTGSRAGEEQGPSPKVPKPKDDNIERLISKPVLPTASTAAANRPVRVSTSPETTPLAPEQLNYLQIDSFLISRENTDARVRADLLDVQKFLAGRGIATTARRYNNGYVLYGAKGFRPNRDAAAERDAFRLQVEGLGKEYRRSGGRYEFKDCAFVSHARTVAGQPF